MNGIVVINNFLLLLLLLFAGFDGETNEINVGTGAGNRGAFRDHRDIARGFAEPRYDKASPGCSVFSPVL